MLRGLIFLVALLAGGGAAWISAGASRVDPAAFSQQNAITAPRTTEVLVAAIDLGPGTLVEPAGMRWQHWPQEALSEAFITRELRPDAVQELDGLIVRSGLLIGEPIHDAKLATGDAGALSVILSSGKRAIAVRISAENSAGGFVLPNDRVDVLHTTSRQNASGQNLASSRVILKNVKVLAVDQTIEGSSDAVVGKTATLELRPDEVEIVAAAEASGALSLALRALADNGEVSKLEVVENRTLRMFRGGQVEIVELN